MGAEIDPSPFPFAHIAAVFCSSVVPETRLLSRWYHGDVSVRRARVNDEFSPARQARIPRATKFYDPHAQGARW